MRSGGISSQEQVATAATQLEGIAIPQAPLRAYSTYRVGGPADLLAVCNSTDQLEAVAEVAQEMDLPVAVLGRGSNLLIADSGFRGLAIVLGRDFATCEVNRESCSARIGAAAKLQQVAKTSGQLGLAGLEWLIGIPGSVGGAVAMNAGCHGRCMSDVVEACTVFDIKTAQYDSWESERLGFTFRNSAVGREDVVISVQLNLQADEPHLCEQRLREYRAYRKEAHPGGRNTGSVFSTPNAWALIKAAGADALSVGSARISQKHANFIVVDRAAESGADDVFELMCIVRGLVHLRTDVWLETETTLVGFSADQLRRLNTK